MRNKCCAQKKGGTEMTQLLSREVERNGGDVSAHSPRNGRQFLSAYEKLKLLVITNQFSPNEHLQVNYLAENLSVGVTPVREALIRLSAEDLITVHTKRGFFAKVLRANELCELYQLAYSLLKAILEWNGRPVGVRIKATDITNMLNETQSDRTAAPVFAVEQLHEQLAMVGGNAQMAKMIRNYNCRTHAVRLIYIEQFENVESSVDYVRTLTAHLQLNNREASIARLKKYFDAKMAHVPELVKEVTTQAFSANWKEHPIQSIEFARSRYGLPVGIGQAQQ
jgi:DNA-binding GntR family transcriptional regulator